MPFDPVAYGQMLDEALSQRPTMGFRQPQQSAPIGMDTGMGTGQSIDGAPTPGPDLGAPMQGGGEQSLQQEPEPGSMTGRAQGKIQAKPPFEIEYRKGALNRVKTFGDVMKAMKPSSRDKYMDWWETQHGAINDRYNMLQKELGQRPDQNADLSRKEKFQMLMEFGIELMRRAGQPNAGGESFAQAFGAARGRKKQAALDHDQKRAQIEAARAGELESIGTYGDALKGQAQIDENAVQMEEARGRMKAASRRRPEIISADQGTYDYDPETRETTPITGIDGKPLTNLKVGSRGGLRDTRVAEEKRFDHLVSLGMPEEAAMRIAYKQPSGDPRKDYLSVFKAAMSSNFGDERKAKEVADAYIEFTYPGETVDARSRTMLPSSDDPLGLRD